MSIRISCKQKVSHQCVIFQSAWPPTREAALFAGKGFLSSMLQHVFQMDVYDVSSTDSKNRNDSDGNFLLKMTTLARPRSALRRKFLV